MVDMTPEDELFYKTLLDECDMTQKRYTFLVQAMEECTIILTGIEIDMKALLKKYKPE